MPSVYVSTTLVQKWKLCESFFASFDANTLCDLETHRMFRKIDMLTFLKQLCVRSLRSKRSCMSSLVHTLCAQYGVVQTLYEQIKTEYERTHPPLTLKPKSGLTRGHKKQDSKPLYPLRAPPPKKHKPQQSVVPMPKTIKCTLKKKLKISRSETKPKPTQSKKKITPRFATSSIAYTHQQYNARDQIIYIGLDDFVQRERTQLECDIISLSHAIAYVSSKLSEPCDVQSLLNDVVEKLKL